MRNKILVAPIFRNKEFTSEARSGGLAALAELAEVEGYTDVIFTAAHAPGVVAVIANSALFERSFYEAAEDLRIIARWGVGYDQGQRRYRDRAGCDHHYHTCTHGYRRRIRQLPNGWRLSSGSTRSTASRTAAISRSSAPGRRNGRRWGSTGSAASGNKRPCARGRCSATRAGCWFTTCDRTSLIWHDSSELKPSRVRSSCSSDRTPCPCMSRATTRSSATRSCAR